MNRNRELVIDMTLRLPDINKPAEIPPEYDNYGRCAVLKNRAFWFAGVQSSHPGSTAAGFYWALAGDILFLSPRGVSLGWQKSLNPEFIEFLLEKLHLLKKYSRIRFLANE